MGRTVFHIDQNCYFASVEMISHPEYKNVPMAVAGDEEKRHGIILAKNELASKAGVKTAEAIWEAKRKCPDLITIPSHYDLYVSISKKLKAMYTEYTDLVESFGIDECWLDVTDYCKGKDPVMVADEIRARVRNEFSLTCSVGVSFNKVFAKLGSDYKKPDATTYISEDNYKDIVWPLPVSDLLFAGKKSASRLSEINVRTIGDLANADKDYISDYLGKAGVMLWQYANGNDDSPVARADYERELKSINNSTTTPEDMVTPEQVYGTLHGLCSGTAARLRRRGLEAGGIALYVRDRDLNKYEHQKGLLIPTDSAKDLFEAARVLFDESYDWHAPIRSIGIKCSKLTKAGSGSQISLFEVQEETQRSRKINDAIDKINSRYGSGTVKNLAELGGMADYDRDPLRKEGGTLR
ncbi:MAG: DNA polymerase IV [Saccharofermentans sp.]|nr:DNA polymerase IV [Saccharofermentans sp.]